MRLYCSSDPKRANAETSWPESIGVKLYGSPLHGRPRIGHDARNMLSSLKANCDQVAWDFLSIALSVVAADNFVFRDEGVDGWTRVLDLEIEVEEPDLWDTVKETLEITLGFLSGDYWSFSFVPNGNTAPTYDEPEILTEDCISLFSGGLDSLIGAIDLLAKGSSPILVSHYKQGEKEPQRIANELAPTLLKHVQVNSNPRGINKFGRTSGNELTSRCRSMLFVALATVCASCLAVQSKSKKPKLYVHENGFISLNVPLTNHRTGSCSTRTTHPFFMGKLQEILEKVGLKVELENPYQLQTKGEMLLPHKGDAAKEALFAKSVSCGRLGRKMYFDGGNQVHWLPSSTHCGICVPCLIRRAAFHRAKIDDQTVYEWSDLSNRGNAPDIKAFRKAFISFERDGAKKSLLSSAPFEPNQARLDDFIDLYVRGLTEVQCYFQEAHNL